MWELKRIGVLANSRNFTRTLLGLQYGVGLQLRLDKAIFEQGSQDYSEGVRIEKSDKGTKDWSRACVSHWNDSLEIANACN